MKKIASLLLAFIPVFGFTQLQYTDLFYNENKYDVIVLEQSELVNVKYDSNFLSLTKDSSLTAINLFPTEGSCIPVGLLINGGKKRTPINNGTGSGNFFLKPNAVFSISKSNKIKIVESGDFKYNSGINFAFQSGPALILDSKVHKKFNYFSKNMAFRSGLGIVEENGVKKLVLVVSKQPVNLFDFSEMFLNRLKCNNAIALQSVNTFLFHNNKFWNSNFSGTKCGAIVFKRKN